VHRAQLFSPTYCLKRKLHYFDLLWIPYTHPLATGLNTYTVSHKKNYNLHCLLYLCQTTVTDFQNSFTGRLCRKFATEM